ncbi:MAG: glycosyltransferase family 2 protein [Bacteroidetes bacterium]|nr:glycosyltransferase family 2 protein [Bacteroidota bacterium]
MYKNFIFSIILPTYNRAQLISKAIESVIGQTIESWELLVIDDGSTDNTKELVQSYIKKDQRIQYHYQENAERSAARNKGIDLAKGEYICFLDSDDYYLPQRLENFYSIISLKQKKELFLYSGIILKKDNKLVERKEKVRSNENIYDFVLKAIIGTPQVCISRKLMLTEKFNPEIRIGEDTELWLRISEIREPERVNNTTIIALEHSGRSVNFHNHTYAKDYRRTLNICFQKNHSGNMISSALKKQLLSNSYMYDFQYYIYYNKRWKALIKLLKSLSIDVLNEKSKLKINLIRLILQGKQANKILETLG